MSSTRYTKEEIRKIKRDATKIKWSKLWFGKYSGKTLPQILLFDPIWFYWLLFNGGFKNKGDKLIKEVIDLDRKSINIRIKKRKGIKMVIEYENFGSGKFGDAFFRPEDEESNGKRNYVDHVIDLSAGFFFSSEWNHGRRIATTQLEYMFGENTLMLTRKECNDFFNDMKNFDMWRRPWDLDYLLY